MSLSDKRRLQLGAKSSTKVSKSLRKNYSSDVGDFRQIEDTDSAIRNVLPPPFRGGNLVAVDMSALTFPMTDPLLVAHGLGKYPKGAAVFGNNTNSNLWLLDENFVKPENLRSAYCALMASAACKFYVWFWR